MRASVWFGGGVTSVALGYVVLPVATGLAAVELYQLSCADAGIEPCFAQDRAIALTAIWWLVLMRPAAVATLVLMAVLWMLMPSRTERDLPPRWHVSIFLLAAAVVLGPACLGLGILYWFP